MAHVIKGIHHFEGITTSDNRTLKSGSIDTTFRLQILKDTSFKLRIRPVSWNKTACSNVSHPYGG